MRSPAGDSSMILNDWMRRRSKLVLHIGAESLTCSLECFVSSVNPVAGICELSLVGTQSPFMKLEFRDLAITFNDPLIADTSEQREELQIFIRHGLAFGIATGVVLSLTEPAEDE